MEVFRFRHFSVSHAKSAMKVNTDAVLLGASMTVRASDRLLLDIGTGTGTIALMAAQRLAGLIPDGELSSVSIEAIDIDFDSAEEAGRNFASSPWNCLMTARHISLENYRKNLSCSGNECMYDLIFSNPPYFESSLKAPDMRRRTARHTDGMSYRDIMSFSSEWLSEKVRLAIILPADTEREVIRYAASWSLYPFRLLRVKSSPRHPVSRIIFEFSKGRDQGSVVSPAGCQVDNLTVRKEGGYSDEYRSLTSDFLCL